MSKDKSEHKRDRRRRFFTMVVSELMNSDFGPLLVLAVIGFLVALTYASG
jgi:hypothetical protein